MAGDTHPDPLLQTDAWLEQVCRSVEGAGRLLVATVRDVNHRTEEALAGRLGRRQRVTDAHVRQADVAFQALRDAQADVQSAIFDCEQEIRALREREVSVAELLVDGENLIRQYRFLRRRARISDRLLSYLPDACSQASACLERLRALRDGAPLNGSLPIPDCTFAGAALEELAEDPAS